MVVFDPVARDVDAARDPDFLVAEHARFTALNTGYTEKFGFPFIIAVKGLDKDDILAAFEKRIGNTADEEFETAKSQVERIALLRLNALLPGD